MISAARFPSFTILMAAARLFEVWSVGREPAQAGISVGASCGDWLIHFVRQRSGQLSHGGHTVDACEIRLRLAQSLQRFFSLLSLNGNARKMDDLPYKTVV